MDRLQTSLYSPAMVGPLLTSRQLQLRRYWVNKACWNSMVKTISGSGMLVSFLKPECIKQYIGKMDGEVRRHLEMHWEGKQKVTVLPLIKTLTFNIICSLLFGIEFGARRDKLVNCFQRMIEGMWSIPINFPFTRYNQSLRASAQVQKILKELICQKRIELEQKGASSHQDLITCLLSIRGKDDEAKISEDEIVDNVMLVMVAGHDTSSVLITFMASGE